MISRTVRIVPMPMYMRASVRRPRRRTRPRPPPNGLARIESAGVHPDLAFALALADLADQVSLPRFEALDFHVETKPDLTPVTEVDREVERELRARIAAERPGDGMLGEELGLEGGPDVRWVLDPIDGTRNFVRGIPIFATLIALEQAGEAVLGVVSAPALARRWWARRGEGAYLNGRRIRVSAVDRIDDGVFSSTSLRATGVLELVDRAWLARTFSDFWQHMLVAEGAVDAAVDHVTAVWDVAALRPIVEEAGGLCTDLAGARRSDGGSLLSTNGVLHAEVLAALAPAAEA